MKVFQINSVCGIGSTGRIAVDLAKAFKEQGHECIIAYGRGEAKGWDKTYRIGNKAGNILHYAYSVFTDKHGLFSRSATKRLVKKIEQENPDVIHLHNIHGYYLHYAVLFDYLKACGKKIVWTFHDCWPFTGHCAYFDFAKCEKWKKECCKCPQKKTYPESYVIDRSRKNFFDKQKSFTELDDLTIVTPSKWLRELIKESFFKEYPVRVINNGIDLNIFKPMDSEFRFRTGTENKTLVLGLAGVWSERKGLADFKKLAELIDDKYRIVLVGISKKQARSLPKNIIAIDKTENMRQLAEIYSAADIFFNPTYEDNFPTVNLEALACGTPVITYRTGGSIESIKEGCGYIIDKGSLDDVIRIAKTEKSEERIKRCRDYAVADFDKNDCYCKYIELYLRGDN